MNESRVSDLAGRAPPMPGAGLARHAWRRAGWSALVLLLALPPLWMSLVAAPRLRVDVGVWGDHTVLSGINGAEQSANEDFRWTAGRAELALPNLSPRYRLLRLRANGSRPQGLPAPLVRLDLDGAPWGSMQTAPAMRVYTILLPNPGMRREVRVGFDSPTFSTPDDPRQLGFAIDWIELVALEPSSGPALWQLAGQTLLLALVLLLLWALELPPGWPPALGALVGGAIVWANARQPLWVSQALAPWLLLAGLLLAATLLLGPRLRRALAPWMTPGQARVAWALFVAALVLRLAGAIHPLFNAHDVDVHTHWLDVVGGGQLYLYSTPSEFHNQQTFNPPAGYLLLMPLWLLLPDSRLVVQCGVALLDALGCLLLVGLARELRLPALAGLLAMALYLALPINTTMLWWGFATNALAQSLWLLLLWVLLRLIRRPTPAATAIFAVISAVCLLTHVGALVLMLAMLGLCVLLGRRALSPAGWRAMLGGLALALLVAGPLYFAAVVGPLLGQRPDLSTAAAGGALLAGWAEQAARLSLVRRGLLLGFLPLTLALAPLGLERLLSARSRHPLQRVLVLSWLAVCLIFLGAYLELGLVVRYIYFAAPLVCLAAGALLAALWRRRGGRVVALAVVLLIAWAGAALWVAGVLMRIKPSAVPLTY